MAEKLKPDLTHLKALQNMIVEVKCANDKSLDEKKLRWEFDELNKEREEKLEKEIEDRQTKADEVYHTTNTNYGEEFIPTDVVVDPIVDQIYRTNDLLSKLPWNHWTGLAISERIPILGEAKLYRRNFEYTTGSFTKSADTKDWAPTDKVVLEQADYISDFYFSKRELNYAVWNLEALAVRRLSEWANRTINAIILNGDTALTWNVNTSTVLTATDTNYFLNQDNGLRKIGIDNNSVTIDTLQDGDYLSMIDGVGLYGWEIDNLMFVQPTSVHTKSLGLDAVKTVDKKWNDATINSGVLSRIYGIDAMVHREYPQRALADGKVHATTWNDYGSMTLFYKPAIQFGFGQSFEFGWDRIIGKWALLTGVFEFGFVIIYEKAELGKTVVSGVKINL